MSSITAAQCLLVRHRAEEIYDDWVVLETLDGMAATITERLSGVDPLVLCVMNGGLFTTVCLLAQMDFPLGFDYLHATRYRDTTQGGGLHWQRPPPETLSGRTVLIVDDILDEGVTLAAIVEACRERGAREVLTAVLVKKQHDRGNGFQADYVGLTVPDRYVFGCGMDYKGYWRNLPAIYAAHPDDS